MMEGGVEKLQGLRVATRFPSVGRALRGVALGQLVVMAAACSSGRTEDVGDESRVSAGEAGDVFHGNSAREILSTKLEVDLATNTGVVTIVFGASDTPGGSLDISGLEVSSVTHGETNVGWTRHVKWPHVYMELDAPAGDSFDVQITYRFAQRPHGHLDGVLESGSTMTFPQFCGNVFPCHTDPADGTTFELSVKNPPPGQTVVVPPVIPAQAPSYMAAWATGPYQYKKLGNTSAGTEVGVYAPNVDDENLMTGTTYLRPAFDWMESNLGAYMFGNKVASVQVSWPDGWAHAQEHHPFWHVTYSNIFAWDLHVHEALHGWFGNGVRLGCWEDLVLSEGTVSYLTAVVLEEVGCPYAIAAPGEDLSPIWKNQYLWRLNTAVDSGASQIAWPSTCGSIDVNEKLLNDVTYMKGAFFYRALEKRLSRPQVIKALAHVYEKFHGKTATMQDVLDQIQLETGYNPNECANRWLRSTTLPETPTCP
jgi:aminopeptidase N